MFVRAAAVLTVNPAGLCVSAPSGLVSWWRANANALDQAGTNNGTFATRSGTVTLSGGAQNINGTTTPLVFNNLGRIADAALEPA